MISMVRAVGAPVIEAAGKRDFKISLKLALVSPTTVETICQTVGYFSMENKSGTCTLPTRAIFPMSLRTMSTIITFSAWFFSEACSQANQSSSSSRVRPRGAVPFICLEVRRLPSSEKNSSGEAEQIVNRPVLIQAGYGACCALARRKKYASGAACQKGSRGEEWEGLTFKAESKAGAAS